MTDAFTNALIGEVNQQLPIYFMKTNRNDIRRKEIQCYNSLIMGNATVHNIFFNGFIGVPYGMCKNGSLGVCLTDPHFKTNNSIFELYLWDWAVKFVAGNKVLSLELPKDKDGMNRFCIQFSHTQHVSPHVDRNDVCNQFIVGLGDYTGGDLICDGECYNIRNRLTCIDGRKSHHVTQFFGDRYTVIFYANWTGYDFNIGLSKQICVETSMINVLIGPDVAEATSDVVITKVPVSGPETLETTETALPPKLTVHKNLIHDYSSYSSVGKLQDTSDNEDSQKNNSNEGKKKQTRGYDNAKQPKKNNNHRDDEQDNLPSAGGASNNDSDDNNNSNRNKKDPNYESSHKNDDNKSTDSEEDDSTPLVGNKLLKKGEKS